MNFLFWFYKKTVIYLKPPIREMVKTQVGTFLNQPPLLDLKLATTCIFSDALLSDRQDLDVRYDPPGQWLYSIGQNQKKKIYKLMSSPKGDLSWCDGAFRAVSNFQTGIWKISGTLQGWIVYFGRILNFKVQISW